MALALDQPANIIGAEHFRRSVQRWSCAATPIHDPTTAVAARRPRHHRRRRHRRPADHGDGARGGPAWPRPSWPVSSGSRRRARPHRASNGPGACTSRPSDAPTPCSPSTTAAAVDDRLRLSRRHSEILLLLASAPRGLSGDELAVLLYEEDDTAPRPCAPSSTGCAACSATSCSRRAPTGLPPRSPPTGSPWRRSWRPATSGRPRCASTAGPLLPRVHRTRSGAAPRDIEASLRQAVLRSGEPDLMSTWTRSSWGATTTTCGPPSWPRWSAALATAAARPGPDRAARPRARHWRLSRDNRP